MKRQVVACVVLMVGCGLLQARDEGLVIDSCDDPRYEIVTPSGHSNTARVAAVAGATAGATGVQVTYEHPPTAAYTASTFITRTLPAPVSLRNADRILVDVQVPVAAPALMLTIDFIDEKGSQARIVSHDLFSKPTNGWTTRAWFASRLDKSRWVGAGRAVNLDRIVKISYAILVQRALTESGSLTFSLDNLRAEMSPSPAGSRPLAHFQRYASTEALASGWKPLGSATRLSLAEGSRPDAKALQVTGTVARPDDDCLAEMVFDSPMDLSMARFVRLVMSGDPALGPVDGIGLVRLIDAQGNCAEGMVWGWTAERDWSTMHLPFLSDGIEGYTADSPTALEFGGMSCWREEFQQGRATEAKTDLTRIAKIQLGFRAIGVSGYPVKDASVRFEEVIVGLDLSGPTLVSARRPEPTQAPPARTPLPGALTPAVATPAPTVVAWMESGAGVLDEALKYDRPVIVYFFSPESPKCAEFERNCLTSADFIRRAGRFVCIREHLGQQKFLAERFGVFRVPHLVVLSRKGVKVASFGHNNSPRDVYNAMDALAP